MLQHLANVAVYAFALYAAFTIQVAVSTDIGPWMPNLVLLAGLYSARRAGVGWAAVAGLLCDALEGRPLGITMLVACLTATIARQSAARPDTGLLREAAGTFLALLLVETSSRALAEMVATTPNHWLETIAATQVAIASAAVALLLRFCAVFSQAGFHHILGTKQADTQSPIWIR